MVLMGVLRRCLLDALTLRLTWLMEAFCRVANMLPDIAILTLDTFRNKTSSQSSANPRNRGL